MRDLLTTIGATPLLAPVVFSPFSAVTGSGPRTIVQDDHLKKLPPHLAHRWYRQVHDRPGCSTVILNSMRTIGHHPCTLRRLSLRDRPCNPVPAYFGTGAIIGITFEDRPDSTPTTTIYRFIERRPDASRKPIE
jgi:hypothetical protein